MSEGTPRSYVGGDTKIRGMTAGTVDELAARRASTSHRSCVRCGFKFRAAALGSDVCPRCEAGVISRIENLLTDRGRPATSTASRTGVVAVRRFGPPERC